VNCCDRWVWVSLPYATFALGIKDGHVVEAPPIAWRTLQWLGTDERLVAPYLLRKGAVIRELPV